MLASGQACDGVAATSVPIGGARSVSAMPGGGYLFVDETDDLVREVSPSGVVTTVAGTTLPPNREGTIEPSTDDAADGSIATQSGLDEPVAVSALPDGGFLVTEWAGCRVRLVTPGGPGVATIWTIAGSPPVAGAGADSPQCSSTAATEYPYAASGIATSMSLNYPTDAEPTADGGVLIADAGNDAVRYVSAAAPGATMETIAGGPPGAGLCDDATTDCDGQAAGTVELDQPVSVSAVQGGSGAFLVAEADDDAVREISGESPFSTFSTVAGVPGDPGYAGDGGPATSAQLNFPQGVTSLAAGGFLIADSYNDVVREVSPAGTISTIAGDGTASFSGDAGDATAAALDNPASVSSLANGNILIADEDNNRIRELTTAAVSTFSVAPSSPDGSDGWYVSYPVVTVTASQKASFQCELDPTQAPSAYGEIEPGCPYTGFGQAVTTNGGDVIYAASKNSFGDLENPVSLPLNVDTEPPTVTCSGDPTFAFGDASAQVIGTLSDSVSGPASKPLTAPASTSSVGSLTATLSGANNAGLPASAQCPYYVTPLTLSPAPLVTKSFKATKQFSKLSSLLVKDIPQGATVEVTCTGKGCPFKVRRNVHTEPCVGCKTSTVTLRMANVGALFAKARLRPGVTIAVIITRSNTVGRYIRYTVRAGKAPSSRSACLAPGATKPTKSCVPARTS
jgi:hypothetical protein